MGRKRMYKDIELPKETVMCVKGLIAEAERQRHERAMTDLGIKVQNAMDEAGKPLENRCRALLVSDIAEGRGYDRSRMSLYMDIKTYYRRRRRYIYDVAIAMGLKYI